MLPFVSVARKLVKLNEALIVNVLGNVCCNVKLTYYFREIKENSKKMKILNELFQSKFGWNLMKNKVGNEKNAKVKLLKWM
jgi:hypothetical protein